VSWQSQDSFQLGSGGTTLSSIIKMSVFGDIPSLAPGEDAIVDFTVPGAQPGGVVMVSPDVALAGHMIIPFAYVSAADTVSVKFRCEEIPQDLPGMDFHFVVFN
jgi:hypothetical protein